MADRHFFSTARKLYGRYTQEQVDALNTIIDYAEKRGTSRLHLAYVLATIYHETAKWMVPIREGARRYGTNYTHEQSCRAVAKIHRMGIIRTNYALPDGPYGQCYYGRGQVQLTWYDNYKKFADLLGVPLDKNPDLMLDLGISLEVTFLGMEKGLFRKGRSLDMIKSTDDYRAARDIINGDVKKNGSKIAKEAMVFYDALENYSPKRRVKYAIGGN